MGQAARQLEPQDAGDWITVAAAAALSGLTESAWRQRARAEATAARCAGRASRAELRPNPSGIGRPTWFVRRVLDARLTAHASGEVRDQAENAALCMEFPPHAVQRAYRRAFWLKHYQAERDSADHRGRTALQVAERVAAEARRTEGEEFGISPRTLQAWEKAFRAKGLRGLIDRRSTEPAGARVARQRAPEAIEKFYEHFHQLRGLSVKACHDVTLDAARENGWNWPATYAATWKWLEAHDDRAMTCLLREGEDVYRRRYLPHADIDYTLIQPGQLYVADHTRCDFLVTDGGEPFRPWLTAIQDARSRVIVGWHLSNQANSDTIVRALASAFKRYAIPEAIRLDNGRDFASARLTGMTRATRDALRRRFGSEWEAVQEREAQAVHVERGDARFDGILHELGVRIIFAIPYAANSKGTVERFFGTLEGQFSRTLPTYCGNKPGSRPENLQAILEGGAVPTLDEARADLADWVDIYHRTPHAGDGMDGATPLDVWKTASVLRRAGADQLAFLMQVHGVYKVGSKGIGLRIHGKTIRYGAAEPKLMRYRGRRVLVTIDPDDYSTCCAWEGDATRRRFIARLESNRGIHPLTTAEEVRDVAAQTRGRDKRLRQAHREAMRATPDVCAELKARRRQRAAALRATGTDHATADVRLVQTGFEGAAGTARKALAAAPAPAPDLTQARRALFEGFGLSPAAAVDHSRPTLGDLTSWNRNEAAPEDDGAADGGMDAGSTLQLLSVVAGERHDERTDE